MALLAEAGAAGFSIEDYDPAAGGMDEIGVAAERVAVAADASRRLAEPMVLTARAENHIRGVTDLDDTIARLIAYRDAGADALYAPGLTDLEQIASVVAAVETPLNVLLLPGGPTVAELAGVGVRRVSLGSLLAAAGVRRPDRGGERRCVTTGPRLRPSALVSRAALGAAFD